MSNFKVLIRFPVGTPDEWGVALATPVDRLPALTSEQSERARRWGISTEVERRNILRQKLAEERLEAEGSKLGKAVQAILDVLDAPGSYELRAIVIDGAKDSWTLQVETPQGMRDFGIEGPLRKRILGTGIAQDQHELKRELLSVLGRTDLLEVHLARREPFWPNNETPAVAARSIGVEAGGQEQDWSHKGTSGICFRQRC